MRLSFRKSYRRLPQEYRSDETGRLFSYFWRRHEYWATQADFEAQIGALIRDPNAPKPVKVEFELDRIYYGCMGKRYVGVTPCNGENCYLRDYHDGQLLSRTTNLMIFLHSHGVALHLTTYWKKNRPLENGPMFVISDHLRLKQAPFLSPHFCCGSLQETFLSVRQRDEFSFCGVGINRVP